MADSTIHVVAGDTETLTITVGATGLSNLDDLTSAALYLAKRTVASNPDTVETTNHVDGATLTTLSSAAKTLTFDPVSAKNGGGNALDAEGTYQGYVKLTWNDGDITRHPAEGRLIVVVADSYE